VPACSYSCRSIRLFEIGKVFGQAGKRYSENDSLGLLLVAEKGRAVNRLRQVLETLLRSLGLSDLIYAPAKIRPAVSHPTASWDILVKDQPVGIIYKLAQSGPTAVALAEVDLNQLTQLSETFQLNPVRELTQKLVVLDANVELSKTRNIQEVLVRTAKLLGARLWSSEIVDAFALPDKIRYTLRVIYQGLSDEEAKAQHAKLFHLVKE